MTDQNSQQNSDLKSIGMILKKKREELSYTLEHVSEITRITLTSIRNIEEGNLDALPGLVFVRGFVRNYAKLLGLESDWMIEALNQTYSGGGGRQGAGNKEMMGDEQPQEAEKRVPRLGYLAVLIGIVVVVGAVVWNLKSDNTFITSSEKVETVQAVEVVAGSDVSNPQESVVTLVEAINEETEENLQTVNAVISPLTLTLVAKTNEWIRLAVDNQEAFELRLKEGEKYDWPAEEEYVLTMTSGSTASIHLNGEEIVDRENYADQLYLVKLNKFTLKQINNR